MSVVTYLRMIVTGARALMTPAHHVVFRMWAAVFCCGVWVGVTWVVVPWPWVLIPAVVGVILSYFSLQVIYTGAQWFFAAGHSAGRRYEKVPARAKDPVD